MAARLRLGALGAGVEAGGLVDEEAEAGPVKEGVLDLMAMHMPAVLAECPRDALAGYIQDWMKARYGEQLDERA